MKRPAHHSAVAKGIAVSRAEDARARVSFYALTSGALLFALLLLGSGRLIGP